MTSRVAEGRRAKRRGRRKGVRDENMEMDRSIQALAEDSDYYLSR